MNSTPNAKTLAKILQLHGYAECLIHLCVDGYVPREFGSDFTSAWRIRDTFCNLAKMAMSNERLPLTLPKIFGMFADVLNAHDTTFLSVYNAAYTIEFAATPSAAGDFLWPKHTISYLNAWRDVLTAIRLYTLYTIWGLNPVLCRVDFSSGLEDFSSASCSVIRNLIASAVRTNVPNGDVKKLLEALRGGSRSGRELKEMLGVKRGILFSRFINPAMEIGLVEPTEVGSSPKQRYRIAAKRR